MTIGLLLVILVTVATLGLGLWASRGAKTAADMMVAGRSVSVGLNAAAISGEYLSAASFMGIAGLIMKNGYDALWYPVGYAAGYLFLLLFIAGPLRRFGAYTIPDFAQGRFDSPVFRKIAVLFVLGIGFFYTMPQMKGAGVTMNTIMGWPYWVGIAVVGSVITLNVAVGGMKGITLVQAFQYWVKLFAISVPVFVILAVTGSTHAVPGGTPRLQFINPAYGGLQRLVPDAGASEIEPGIGQDENAVQYPHVDLIEVVWPASVPLTERVAYEQRVKRRYFETTPMPPGVVPLSNGRYARVSWVFNRPVIHHRLGRDIEPVYVYGRPIKFKGADGAPANGVVAPPAGWAKFVPQKSTTVRRVGTDGNAYVIEGATLMGKALPAGIDRAVNPGDEIVWKDGAKVEFVLPATGAFESQQGIANRPPREKWIAPYGPLTQKHGYPLLYTYSLIVALVCGTAGLPHILVRFYTNPDGRAARRTAFWTMVLLGAFYVFTPIWGTLGRALLPILYANNTTDSVVIRLPEAVVPGVWGKILTGVTAAGAFAAFMSTFSGLLVSMSGAFAHDVYGTILRPNASDAARRRAFGIAAVVIGAVAMALGLLVESFDIAMMVGWAFAIGAASYFPLLLLGIWWRGLTATGAAAGMLLGGLASLAAIVTSMLLDKKVLTFAVPPLARALMEQPAIWGVPLAIGTMVVVSKMTNPPASVAEKMLKLHAPDGRS